ncbi:hypothetical protein [Bifidobacterium oedipodis]|nr:hypothetical protein [Bifidobacterium sp. DSM 109957]
MPKQHTDTSGYTPRKTRRFATALSLPIAIMVMLSACSSTVQPNSSQSTASPHEDANASSQNSQQSEVAPETDLGAQYAHSISEYIDYYLNQSAIISEYEKTALEHAKQEGEVSVTAYESAWSTYKQCMTDKGYSNVIVDTLANGVHQRVASEMIDDTFTYNKALSDEAQCYADIDTIAQIYNAQIGNVNFYTNQDEAIVDCLRRNNLVPSDYTSSTLNKERSSQQYSFNRDDINVVTCFVTNNYFYPREGEPTTNWFE